MNDEVVLGKVCRNETLHCIAPRFYSDYKKLILTMRNEIRDDKLWMCERDGAIDNGMIRMEIHLLFSSPSAHLHRIV